MKNCSPSLTIKEIQIKTTLKFYLTPVQIVIKKDKQQMMVRMWGKRNLQTLLMGM
jgi:hypothetical protein